MPRRTLIASLLVVSLFLVGRSFAQATCAAPSIWAPALVPFCPDSPAYASEVNQNFSALVNYMQQKVGPLGNTNLTVTGATTLQGLTVNGATTTVNGAATVNGALQARTLRTTVTTIAPTTAVTYTSQTFAATDLTTSFTVPPGGATVELSYTMASDTAAPCFFVTRLMLSGTEVIEARALSGQVQYPTVFGRSVRQLTEGTYTATVEYRTNGSVISSPNTIAFTQRSLVVHMLGNN